LFGRQQKSSTPPAQPVANAKIEQPKAHDLPISSPQRVAPAGDWYVVVATYRREQDAARRALRINRKWPRFKAEVFSPPLTKQKPYYVVILGSNLSDKAAAHLRAQARKAGVARDAYVTRFR